MISGSRIGRRGLAAIVGGVAALAVTGATVFACAVLTTTSLSQNSGPAGTTVTLTGTNFGVAHGDHVQANFSPVQVRLDSPTGTLLATTTPSATGAISVPVTIPEGTAPGYHVLLVMQSSPTGAPVPGSPGRVLFQVGSSQSSTGSFANPVLQDVSAPSASSGGLGVLAVIVMAVGGLLLAGVGTLVGVREVTARRRASVA